MGEFETAMGIEFQRYGRFGVGGAMEWARLNAFPKRVSNTSFILKRVYILLGFDNL